MKKKLSVAAVVMATSGIVVAGISPAQAIAVNALPAGDSLYVIDAGGDGSIYETTATGEMTKLSLQIPDISTGGSYPAGALSPIDNSAYLVFVDSTSCAIDKVDLLGGAPAARVPVVSAHPVKDCYGLNIAADGTALIYGSYVESSAVYAIWSIDLTTGVLTNEIDIPSTLYGFTVDPAGDWFGLKSDGHLQGINKVTGQFTQLVNHTLNDVYDCKMDSAGTLWFTNEEGAAPYQLYSWRVGDADYTLQGDTTVNGLSADGLYGPTFVGTSTQTIAHGGAAEATLPDTGASAIALVATGVIAAGLIAAGALALIMVRRRQATK